MEILDTDDRIGKLVVTNTIPIPLEKQHPKIVVMSVAPLLAEIIERVHEGVSISEKLILSKTTPPTTSRRMSTKPLPLRTKE